MRCQRKHSQTERKEGSRDVQCDGLPTLFVEDITVDRITKTEVQEQRSKECECNIVEQAYGEIEILPKVQGSVDMKNERRKADHREMEHEWRAASLFEQDEEADAQPDQSDDRKKYDRRGPARQRVEISQISVIKIIGKRVRRFLVVVGECSPNTGRLQIHGYVGYGSDLVEGLAIDANREELVAGRDAGPRCGEPGQYLFGINATVFFNPENTVGRWKLVIGALRQIEGSAGDEQNRHHEPHQTPTCQNLDLHSKKTNLSELFSRQ